MRIEMRDRYKIKFRDVEMGQIFTCCGKLYIKVEDNFHDNDDDEAVILSNGELCRFELDRIVELVDGAFVEGYKND